MTLTEALTYLGIGNSEVLDIIVEHLERKLEEEVNDIMNKLEKMYDIPF